MYKFKVGDLNGGSHRKNQSVLVHWHRGVIDTWVVAPKLIMVAEAKTNEL